MGCHLSNSFLSASRCWVSFRHWLRIPNCIDSASPISILEYMGLLQGPPNSNPLSEWSGCFRRRLHRHNPLTCAIRGVRPACRFLAEFLTPGVCPSAVQSNPCRVDNLPVDAFNSYGADRNRPSKPVGYGCSPVLDQTHPAFRYKLLAPRLYLWCRQSQPQFQQAECMWFRPMCRLGKSCPL